MYQISSPLIRLFIFKCKATERKLRPQRKESTPQEMLMESIRGCSARSSLRKTKGPPVKPLRK